MICNKFLQSVVYLLAGIFVFSGISCGGIISKGSGDLPGQLVVNIFQAKTDPERMTALKNVLCQGLSLGFTDEKGNQLNPNVAKDVVSVSSQELEIFNYYINKNQGCTIDDIIGFLADAGVVLSSTQKVITTADVLPDIQKYVDWSFSHRDDHKALFGLMLAAGPGIQIPGASPVFQNSTQISLAAGTMMLGDILIGVKEKQTSSSNLFIEKAYAADVSDLATIIQGMLTSIEAKLNERGITVPAIAKQILEAFAAGNHFAVRLIQVRYERNYDADNIFEETSTFFEPVKSITTRDEYMLQPVLVLVPSGKILTEIPVTYSFNLLGPTSVPVQSNPLYPDADVVMRGEATSSKWIVEYGGHRLGLVDPLGSASRFWVSPKNLTNTETRAVFLHASARINAPDLKTALAKYSDIQIPFISIESILETAQEGLKVAPWLCTIAIPPDTSEVYIEPRVTTGEIGKEYVFRAVSKDNKPFPSGYKFSWYSHSVSGTFDLGKFTVTSVPECRLIFDKDEGYQVVLTVYKTATDFINAAPAEITIKSKVTSSITLDIEVPDLLETNYGLNFKAIPSLPLEQIPQNTAWKWDFGDGSAPYIRIGRSEVYLNASHPFAKNGTYEIKLSLVDRTSDQVYATTSKKIIIDDSVSLSKTNRFSNSLHVYGKVEGDGPGLGLTLKGFGHGFYQQPPLQTFQWSSATSFKGTWQETSTTSRGVQTNIHELEGTISVSSQGIKITSYTYTHTFNSPDYEGPGKGWKYTEKVMLKDVPLTKINGGDEPKYTAKIQGNDLAQYVIQTTREEYFANGQQTFFNQPVWDNIPQGVVPLMEITIDYAE
jgi:PKD repeat protein